MFLHLGGYAVIQSKDVVAILNYDEKDTSLHTDNFLAHVPKEDVVHISEEGTKSVVITDTKVFYSPISSVTLKRRAVQGHDSLHEEDDPV
ncbi:extracellular matrix regulator RemB [Geomicrobium sp. JSM 1781026]|uniref:extracellular matrix regulator RemB n=1 Tax=Geomicrobium sp. JSM 1781026 TaxID=3344580 RepID=UPI0035C14753